MEQKEHWEKVYQSKASDQVSWYKAHLSLSLDWILGSLKSKSSRVIDVGGGSSTLVDDLLAKGYIDITVLDISQQALKVSKDRLGALADKVTWIEAGITRVSFPPQSFDVWHDRAIFHFLTDPVQRKKYIETLKSTLKTDGFLIMATFSLEGPLKCSGLHIVRYSPETLSGELGDGFSLVKTSQERHQTPFGTFQNFTYCLFKRN
ncbi:MAG: class I SAM-dependent methyltransferase [Nitrosomonas ureae]